MEWYGSCHNHTDRSNFRLRDCTNKLEQLCNYAVELGHNFIAITDHETIATAVECQELEEKIREKNPDFKIIRGNEIYLCRNGLNKDNFVKGEDKFYHFILLAKDEIGHRQLRELSTRAWLRAFELNRMLRVPTYYSDLQEIVGQDKGHVIFCSACLGSRLAQLAVDFNKEPTEDKWNYLIQWIENIKKICGDENFFLEVQLAQSEEQKIVYKVYDNLSKETNTPIVISLDAHYLKKEDKEIHHAFLTAQDGDRETDEFYATTYMMTTEEIHEYMDDEVGAEKVSEWISNTRLIYDKCEYYDLTKPLHIPYLPLTIDKITEKEFLMFKDKIKELQYFYESPVKPHRDLAAAIVKKIIEDGEEFDNEATFRAIDECLTAIRLASEKQKTPWSAYLLNMRDYINVIWEKGDSLTGCGRGSGPGFFLLHLLGIIQINPIKEKVSLKAWRFLNPERVSPLDYRNSPIILENIMKNA